MITNINKIANLNAKTNADRLAKRNNSFNSFDTNRKFAKANKNDVMKSFAELVQHRDKNLDKLKGKHIEEDVKLKSPFEELPLNGINSFINSLRPNSGGSDMLGVLSELNDNPFSDSSLISHTENQTLDNTILYAIDKPLNQVLDSGLSKLEQSILNKNGFNESTKNAINMLDRFSIQEIAEKNQLAELLDGKGMALNSSRSLGKGIGEQLSDELLKLGIKINFDQNKDNTISIKGLEFADNNIDNAKTVQDLLKNLESNGLLKSSIKLNDLELNKIASKYNTSEDISMNNLENNKQVFSKDANHDLDFAGGKEQQSNSSDFSMFGKMNQEFSPINSALANPKPEQMQRTKLDELPQTIVKFVAETPANGSSQATLHLNPDNLGKVKVEISMQDNSVHLKITAESEEAKAAIGEQLNSLRDKLDDKGLKTTQIDLFTQQDSQNAQSETSQKRQEENDARRQYIDMMRRMQDLDKKSIPLDTTINNNSKA